MGLLFCASFSVMLMLGTLRALAFSISACGPGGRISCILGTAPLMEVSGTLEFLGGSDGSRD